MVEDNNLSILDFIRSKIEKTTDKKIRFYSGEACNKDKGGLNKWVRDNFIAFLEDGDIKKEAQKGLTYFQKEVETCFREIIKKEKIEVKELEMEGEEEIMPLSYEEKYLNNLVPVINDETKDPKSLFLMVDTADNNRISKTSFLSWKTGRSKEEVAAATNMARRVKLKYLPTTTSSFMVKQEPNGEKYQVLNIYYPPRHRVAKIIKPVVPQMVTDFLKNLFLNEECYKYMMCSIWYVLNDRLQIIPVLNGGTGVGKGLFAEHLLSKLVGRNNAILAPTSWDKSGFNAWLSNKQLIVFDEAKIISRGKDSNVDIIKRIMNDTLNVEKKGIDADKLTDNHASMFITSNNGSKRFTLEIDNRRFAPVDLTTDKVNNLYSKKDREALVDLLQDDEVIANFYWDIIYNWNPKIVDPQRTPHTILQCESLFKFQFESLDLWQRGIAELLISKESSTYNFAQVNASYRKVYTRITGKDTNTKRSIELSDARDFIQSYRHYGDTEPMGYFETGSDGLPVLKPNDKYESENKGYNEVSMEVL